METPLTMKAVLEQFATAGFDVAHESETGQKRTLTGLCPLQLVTGKTTGYVEAALRRDLTSSEIFALVTWADHGYWRWI